MKKSKLPVEQVDKILIDTQTNYDYKICGFPALKGDGNTEVCKKPAGWGTEHQGFGYCRIHGGSHGKKTVGGLYSKYVSMKPDILARYQEFLNDEDIKSIDGEIALMRSKTADMLLQSTTTDNAVVRQEIDFSVIRLADLVTRAVERKRKMEEGEKYTLSVDSAKNMILQIIGIINDEVKDASIRIKLLQRLQNEVKP